MKKGGGGGQGLLGSERGSTLPWRVSNQRCFLAVSLRLCFTSPGCNTISCLTRAHSSSALPSHARKNAIDFPYLFMRFLAVGKKIKRFVQRRLPSQQTPSYTHPLPPSVMQAQCLRGLPLPLGYDGGVGLSVLPTSWHIVGAHRHV